MEIDSPTQVKMSVEQMFQKAWAIERDAAKPSPADWCPRAFGRVEAATGGVLYDLAQKHPELASEIVSLCQLYGSYMDLTLPPAKL